jgi:tetratricopeptide (TPR) repeat protein
LEATKTDVTSLRARALAAGSDFARMSGELELARQFCEEGLALSRQLGDQAGVSRALHELGEAAAEEEAYGEAANYFEQAIEVAHAAGLPATGSIANLGWIASLQGNPERAEGLFLQALESFRERGHVSGILVALSNLAETKIKLDEPEEARRYLVEAFALVQEAGVAGEVAISLLITAAELFLETGEAEVAARLIGASDARLEASGCSLQPAEERRRRAIRDAIHARLGAPFDQLRDQGRQASSDATDLAAQALASPPLARKRVRSQR